MPQNEDVRSGLSPRVDGSPWHSSALDAQLAAFLAGLAPPGRVLVFGDAAEVARVTSLALPHVVWVSQEWAEDGSMVAGADRALPFEDGAFEAVIAVGFRAVLSSTLPAVLSELWRVSSSLVLHLEAEGAGARIESAWRGIHPFPVQRWPDIGGTELLAVAHLRSRVLDTSGAVVRLEQLLRDERARVAASHAEVAQLERQLADARAGLEAFEKSRAFRLASSVAGLPVVRLASKAAEVAERARTELALRGLVWPRTNDEADPPRRPEVPSLEFYGLATRGTPNDPEQFLRDQPRVVVLCHPEWRGIRAATHGQAAHILEVPGIVSSTHAKRLALFLRDSGAERVVMNGYPPGTARLARALADLAPEIEFFCVFHGTPAQAFHEHEIIVELLRLADEKLVKKLGFVKHGLADYFRQRGYPAEYVMNICRMPSLPPAPAPASGELRVGVFAPNLVHKNVETQIIGALMVPGTVIHTIEPVPAGYLQPESHRIVPHRLMAHADFVKLLGTMHATTYVSLVECYPMTVLESIFCGAICLTSNTSQIFEFDDELRSALVVEQHDSPAAIARKLSGALERREELVPRAQAYLRELNARAERRWNEFLEE